MKGSCPRKRPAAQFAFIEAAGHYGSAEQIPRPASNADTSEWWALLKWDWIYNRTIQALQAMRSSDDKDDLAMTMAVAVVERLANGVPELQAYNQAASVMKDYALRDRLCGMTGGEDSLRYSPTVAHKGMDAVEHPSTVAYSTRLTKGDRAALQAFLRRTCPDAAGSVQNKGRQLVEAVLFEGKSHALAAQELGMTPGAAASARSRVLKACYEALA